MTEETFIFGPFHFTPARGALRNDGRTVQLGNRAMEVLAILVEHGGELVRHEEIFQRVWPTTFVGESNLRVHIRSIRRALGEEIGGERYVLNVPGRGYRFVAPVHVRSFEAGHDAFVEPPSQLLPRQAGHPLLQAPRRRFRECVILLPSGARRMGVAKVLIGLRAVLTRNDRYLTGRERPRNRYPRAIHPLRDRLRLVEVNRSKPATPRPASDRSHFCG